MKDFEGRVAVITGAASGIGRALAEKGVQEGMKVVLADVEATALDQTAAALQSLGGEVLAVPTDVSQAAEVEALAERAQEVFGGVQLLVNNAGVGAGTTVWESTLADWEWVLGVNLWGVIHGVQSFLPQMLAQGTEAHIVNTASIAGLIAGEGLGPYKVSKHAVVSLSETLYFELEGSQVGVSVLCPGWVQTQIADAERNRPEELQNQPPEPAARPEAAAAEEFVRQAVAGGITPGEVATAVFEAIRQKQLYILTHPEMKGLIRRRMNAILEG